MQPYRSSFRQAAAKIDIVPSEALSEFFPVTAAADHLHDIAGQKEQETERPEQVCNETHPAASASISPGRKNKTSVAPYRFARTISQGPVSETFPPGRSSRTKIPFVLSNCTKISFDKSFSV